MVFPKMITISQQFPRDKIDDPALNLKKQFIASELSSRIKPGSKIAITAGSRGIAGIAGIVSAVVEILKEEGAEPFLVPAMGSHGGGIADGQLVVLDHLGITESSTGAPIHSSMETTILGKTASGADVHVDRLAAGADGIVVVNRVKAHTAFHGNIESGLCKMIAVGLGKHRGAEVAHSHGLGDVIVEHARYAMERLPFLFGVAILENAYDETADIMVVPPDKFEEADREFVARSRKLIPRLPVDTFDILIVDEMGKNISGTGMDTNVIGFWRRYGGERDPDYDTLIVRSLTPESNGNAMGIGLADLTTHRLADTIDFKATYANAITSQLLLGKLPVTLDTDRDCIEAVLGKYTSGAEWIVRIKNTRDLATLSVSENLVPALTGLEHVETSGKPVDMQFDDEGFLL